MFVKPKSGLRVRDPQTRGLLPASGAEVPQSLYWTRRVRDGDVIECTPPASSSATASPKATSAQEASK